MIAAAPGSRDVVACTSLRPDPGADAGARADVG